MTAERLGNQRGIKHAEAEAAVILGHHDAGDTELHQPVPDIVCARFTVVGGAGSDALIARFTEQADTVRISRGSGQVFIERLNGSGVATLGLPNSPGVPDALAALTLTSVQTVMCAET